MTGTRTDLTPEQYEAAAALFAELLEVEPGSRNRLLDERQPESVVRAEVESLLAELVHGSLEDGELGRVGDLLLASVPGVVEPVPATIGPFRVLERLGQGGMGSVYLAEQTQPIARQVAVKVIRGDRDSGEVLARFQVERQTLARLDHPYIARVLEAGATEGGAPYFVMEYVAGRPITEFCDQQRLPVRRRLELFLRVCQAVHHAHQRGVIHRDLKPSNLLVTTTDGEPVPKVIDFGVARAIESTADEDRLTAVRQIIGTPDYMAPEQLAGAADIDIRVDVYALGVLLYELLTGRVPLAVGLAMQSGLEAMLRCARDVEPAIPSARVSTLGADAEEIARRRHVDARRLRSELRGEIDWIVARALEKVREQRYGSAAELAADVQRFLAGEPVLARAPSSIYRVRKLARRHRGLVAAAGLVVVSLGAGGVTTLVERQRFEQKVEEFDLLSGVVQHRRAVEHERELHPAWPERIPDLERWLREEARPLLAMRASIQATVASLGREIAKSADDRASVAGDLAEASAERDLADRRVRLLQRIRDARLQPLEPAVLSDREREPDRATLQVMAWERVAPEPGERVVYGEESTGLAAALLAIEKADAAGDPNLAEYLTTLAWAWFVTGHPAEAAAAIERAIELAPRGTRTEQTPHQEAMRDLEAHLDERLAAAEAELVHANGEVETARLLASAARATGGGFLLGTLLDLLGLIDRFEADEVREVEQRLEWARGIRELTARHPIAGMDWGRARELLAASPRYAGVDVEFTEEDVLGLVPIGMNPVSGLFECYHLRSAARTIAEARAVEVPAHRADGSIDVGEATGIVFVLLPGGRAVLGAQSADLHAPNFDPNARPDEAVYEVELDPFFLARHELTQAQYARLWRSDLGLQWPSYFVAGTNPGDVVPIGPTNPVENVSWSTHHLLLTRVGLVLPTEAQWEYACRAGGRLPWYCRPLQLVEHENLADQTAHKWTGMQSDPWDDGHMVHAPVGSFRANPFGLFDMHGNVCEHVQDVYATWGIHRGGDGLRIGGRETIRRVFRGGCFHEIGKQARSAKRSYDVPTQISNICGVRAARRLHPVR